MPLFHLLNPSALQSPSGRLRAVPSSRALHGPTQLPKSPQASRCQPLARPHASKPGSGSAKRIYSSAKTSFMWSSLGSPVVGAPFFLRWVSPARLLAPAAALWAACWGFDKPHSFPPTPASHPCPFSSLPAAPLGGKGQEQGRGGEESPLTLFPLLAGCPLHPSSEWDLDPGVVAGDRKDLGLGSGAHLLEVSIIASPVVRGNQVAYSWESHCLLGCLGPLGQVPKKETISCEGETWVGWGGVFQ